jgi:hypothetical protein
MMHDCFSTCVVAKMRDESGASMSDLKVPGGLTSTPTKESKGGMAIRGSGCST